MNRTADGADVPPTDRPEPLSRFEGRCLYRRTCECEEALQLAVLGVEHTQGAWRIHDRDRKMVIVMLGIEPRKVYRRHHKF